MRHSVGNSVVNALASALGLSWRVEGKYRGYICETENDKDHFIILKPRLLMNVNGRSVVKTGINNKKACQFVFEVVSKFSSLLHNHETLLYIHEPLV